MTFPKNCKADALRYLTGKNIKTEDFEPYFDKAEQFFINIKENTSKIYKVFDFPLPDFFGKDIREHIKNCDKFILLAITLGLSADKAIKRSESEGIVVYAAADALCSAYIDILCDLFEESIKTDFKNKKLGKIFTSRFSPGYGDFPLSAQSFILEKLNATKKIGLYCNSSFMLFPTKSITALIGIKNE